LGLERAFSFGRDGSISALCNRFSNNNVRSFRAGWSTKMRQKIRQIGFAVVAALVLAYSAGQAFAQAERFEVASIKAVRTGWSTRSPP
jgi:hypothetical protein